MEAFYAIRNMNDIQKKPSTSELIDWIQALVIGGISPDKIRKDYPFMGVLLKKNVKQCLGKIHRYQYK